MFVTLAAGDVLVTKEAVIECTVIDASPDTIAVALPSGKAQQFATKEVVGVRIDGPVHRKDLGLVLLKSGVPILPASSTIRRNEYGTLVFEPQQLNAGLAADQSPSSANLTGLQEVPGLVGHAATQGSGRGEDYERGYREGYRGGFDEGYAKAKSDKPGSGVGFALGFFLSLIGVVIAAGL
jgi:hypothetical protein